MLAGASSAGASPSMGIVVMSGSHWGDPVAGSPEVKALGGQGIFLSGSVQGASNQEGCSESERISRRN